MNHYESCPDIYFCDAYPKLYEKIENGMAEKIVESNEFGTVVSHVIKREIPIKIDGKQYYDLVTPYGYGGPIITELKGDKKALVKRFNRRMEEYSSENDIVSEFVRFHPILGNGVDFLDIYNSQYDRKTVGTNVKDFEIEEEFSKSARKYIKRAEKAGVIYEVSLNPSNVDEFKKIYYSTMDRDQADDYYYFNDEYFQQCLTTLGEHVLYVKVIKDDIIIAAGFYFVCGDILQCHLSGTLSEYLNISPAYITKIATARWAKENGIHYIHYGGGTSRDSDNSLYTFKKKFGKNTEFDFYVGKKIWNEDIYSKLCEKVNANVNSNYFPAYRE